MAAANYNLIIDQGSDFAIELKLSETGIPTDLTGYSVRAQMRKKASSFTATAAFTCNITDAINGIINMSLDNTTTAGIKAGIYYYDLEIFTAADAFVERLLKGKATVDAEVTR